MIKTNLYLKIFCIVGTLSLINCVQFNRSADSGYGKKSVSFPSRNKEKKHPPSSANRGKLQNLENSLSGKKEIEQYSKILPYFRSNEEREEFLSLGNFEDRQTWINDKKFLSRPQEINSDMRELVEAQDITVGMPQSLVKQSWGEPDLVEVSGNQAFKNERWKYNRYISTSDGFKAEKKLVYFEGGRVVGWEVE